MITTENTLNNTGITLKRFYKVPHGQELRFAGRYLKAIGHSAGAINFIAANGKLVCLPNCAAERLAQTTEMVRVTSPEGFL